MKIYSVYEDKNLKACITDGYDRQQVIQAAEDYYCTRAEENSEWGDGEHDAVLITYDETTDAESAEEITLRWHAEKDTYDGGRFDYLAGIGAIRSF